MLLTPVALAVAAADAAALAALAGAAGPAARVVRGWETDATAEQLRRERDAERVSLLVRSAAPALLAGALLLVLGVAQLLPPLVPGAMCGTGVLESAAGLGGRALLTRFLAGAALWALLSLDAADRTSPLSRLGGAVSKGALLVLPLAALSAWDTASLLFGLDVVRPVDCCASAVPGPLLGGGALEPLGPWGSGARLALAGGLGLLLVVLAPRARGLRGALLLAAGAAAFVPAAAVALLADLVPYHYGVLAHHCPWCLFLPRNRLAGWLLFGALAVVALEAAAAVVVAAAGAGEAGRERVARAGRTIAVATVLFLLGAAAPALVWRLRFGMFL